MGCKDAEPKGIKSLKQILPEIAEMCKADDAADAVFITYFHANKTLKDMQAGSANEVKKEPKKRVRAKK